MSAQPHPQSHTVTRYLQKRSLEGPWRLQSGDENRHLTKRFHGVIVIPALAEGDSLFATINSLMAIPVADRKDVLILIVINQTKNADPQTTAQNQADLQRLQRLADKVDSPLAWLDAASPGLELASKKAGVGLARKLGMDAALPLLNGQADPLLICLDADTLVEPNYLQAIRHHYQHSKAGAAVHPFRHQTASIPEQQQAIDRYELFLRCYVLGLELAGSPYAFNSVGSAISCRAQAYIRCGGMNQRLAGEDFYFLQKLAKTDGVERLRGTTVYPSPRSSSRTPFGTGRSMQQLLEPQGSLTFYPVAPFQILAQWLKLIQDNTTDTAENLLNEAQNISPILADFLHQADWEQTWQKLQQNHRSAPEQRRAFHIWFDGLKTLRLIHALCDATPRDQAEQIVPELFCWGKIAQAETLPAMLEQLRQQQQGKTLNSRT